MKNSFLKYGLFCCLFAAIGVCALQVGRAQGTGFTYQGKLTDNGNPANGTFDLQFTLFDAVSGGAQTGATLVRDDVVVINGVFTVQLDFGAGTFPGAARFLDIGVRPGASTDAFTLLSPRQPVQSTPYAIRSLNAGSADALSATCVGCVTGAQIGGLPAGNGNYIQNTNSQQPASDFNISGTGTANIVNAVTQFNLNGNRILSASGTNNTFAGLSAGAANTTGTNNTFFGRLAGSANTTGGDNSYFGALAGNVNATTVNNSFFGAFAGRFTTASANSFFGSSAGRDNTTGAANAFFGVQAGLFNTTGSDNVFLGGSAGDSNTSGSNNTFVGRIAGQANTEGSSNAFFGRNTGASNTTGSFNTLLGTGANVAVNNLTFATAVGSGTTVSTSNTVVLGRNADTVQVPGALNVTGALTANGAGLTNLNAGNITTGVLGVARGGTGLAAAGAAGNLLRSDGANWISAPFQAADVPGGSTLYIQNQSAVALPASFNISGTGSANIVNAGTQFNLNGSRILSDAGNQNVFVGPNTGTTNTGGFNTFVGEFAGATNLTGGNNTFVGSMAGDENQGGRSNVFIGFTAGGENTSGEFNTFVGSNAGVTNVTGSSNTTLGNAANVGAAGLDHVTVIGAGATGTTNDSVFLGRGVDTVRVPGALNVTGATTLGATTAGATTLSSTLGVTGAATLSSTLNVTGTTTLGTTTAGATTLSSLLVTGNGTVNGNLTINGATFVNLGATGASQNICINGSDRIVDCMISSARYKTNVTPLRAGLAEINRLRPVNFTWKTTNETDFGLIAEEVAEITPILSAYDKDGALKGVRYDKLPIVLVNAVKEQQALIQQQQQQLRRQEAELELLRQAVCELQPRAAACQPPAARK